MRLSNLLFIFGFSILIDKVNIIDNNLYIDNYLDKLLVATFLSLPIIYRNGEKCNSDNDCPHIMRCCQIGNIQFCCTPNNYIKLDFSYAKNYITPSEIKNLK